jgi:hypothetical protein
MSHINEPPKTFAEAIDEIERIREELLSVQRALEKLEPVESLVSSAGTKT